MITVTIIMHAVTPFCPLVAMILMMIIMTLTIITTLIIVTLITAAALPTVTPLHPLASR